jgi:hypothetical protein
MSVGEEALTWLNTAPATCRNSEMLERAINTEMNEVLGLTQEGLLD